MNKQLMSHYGWIVIVAITFAVLLAFATPFGEYVGDAVVNIAQSMKAVNDDAIDSDHIKDQSNKWGDKFDEYEGERPDKEPSIDPETCVHAVTSLTGKKDATCGAVGNTGKVVCNDCNTVLREGEEIPKLSSHGTTKLINKKDATCSDKGYTGDTVCTVCNTVIRNGSDIPASGSHNPVYGGSVAIHLKCSLCNKTINDAHQITTKTLVAADCVTKGKTEHSCPCGYSYTTETSGYGPHTLSYVGTENVHEKCSKCSYSVSTHSLQVVETINATCTEDGRTVKECICGYTKINTIPKTGHAEGDTVGYVAASCKADGYTGDVKCKYCDVILTNGSAIPKGEHTLVANNDEALSLCSSCNGYVVPKGGVYYTNVTLSTASSPATLVAPTNRENIYVEGDVLYSAPQERDIYFNNDYIFIKGYENGAGASAFGDSETFYKLGISIDENTWYLTKQKSGSEGWGVTVRDVDDTTCPDIVDNVAGVSVTSAESAFYESSITSIPKIPDTVKSLRYAFSSNSSLSNASDFVYPQAVEDIKGAFFYCDSLLSAPDMSDLTNVTEMDYLFASCTMLNDITGFKVPDNVISLDYVFTSCHSLVDASIFEIPSHVKYATSMFGYCTSLQKAPTFNKSGSSQLTTMSGMFEECWSLMEFEEIPENITNINYAFAGCTSLNGDIYCNAENITSLSGVFIGTGNNIYLCGSSPVLWNLAATDGYEDFSTNDNVRIVWSTGTIPTGGIYYDNGGVCHSYTDNYDEYAQNIYREGDNFPVVKQGDIFVYGEYEYRYCMTYDVVAGWTSTEHYRPGVFSDGWGVKISAAHKDKTDYSAPLEFLGDEYIIFINDLYFNSVITVAPRIPQFCEDFTSAYAYSTHLSEFVNDLPETAISLDSTFQDCYALTEALEIPNSVDYMSYAFLRSTIKEMPDIPEGVTDMEGAFMQCEYLTYAKTLPSTVTNANFVFASCHSIVATADDLFNNTSLTQMNNSFNGATSLLVAPKIPSTVVNLTNTFRSCESLMDITNIKDAISQVDVLDGMFTNCYGLSTIHDFVFDNHNGSLNELFRMSLLEDAVITINSEIQNGYEGMFDNLAPGSAHIGVNGSVSNALNPNELSLYEIAKTDGIDDGSLNDPVRSLVHNKVVANGAEYFNIISLETLTNGAEMPNLTMGDTYTYGSYKYIYGAFYDFSGYADFSVTVNGWSVKVLDKNQTTYEPMLEEINGAPVVCLDNAFVHCTSMTKVPIVSKNAITMNGTFYNCSSITTLENVVIPETVREMKSTFIGCSSITDAAYITIPENVVNMNCTFMECYNMRGIVRVNAQQFQDYTGAFDLTLGSYTYGDAMIYLEGSSPYLEELTASQVYIPAEGYFKCKVAPDVKTFNNTTVPEGSKYYASKHTVYNYYLEDNFTEYSVGDILPSEPRIGDMLEYENYRYICGLDWSIGSYGYLNKKVWSVEIIDTSASSYTEPLAYILGTPVEIGSHLYQDSNITVSPTLPYTLTNLSHAFNSCDNLQTVTKIPFNAQYTSWMFSDCDNLQGVIEIDAIPTIYSEMFINTQKEIWLTGSSSSLNELAATDGYSDNSDRDNVRAVNSVLNNNSWETIQNVVKAGKVEEVGWGVGDTKDLQINGETQTATIIGLNHDGNNTATFMIISSDGIGYHVMNTASTNAGGWEASEMRKWLNEDIYNSMSNKDYIKEITKMTNNVGENGNSVTGTQDKVFLLSPKEVGIEWQMSDSNYWDWPNYVGMNALNSEGTTYEWFESNTIDDWVWLRSPDSNCDNSFFNYGSGYLDLGYADFEYTVCPAFVIG